MVKLSKNQWIALASVVAIIIAAVIGRNNSKGASKTYAPQVIENSPNSLQIQGNVTVTPKKQQRMLDNENYNKLKELLSAPKIGRVQVLYLNGDDEAKNLAQQIYDRFLAEGWPVGPGISFYIGEPSKNITVTNVGSAMDGTSFLLQVGSQ